ncbi:unnamed protein product [Dovyalis caffra]|uniref:E2F-associated phosphoprotein n=1 Tax=Dovyalis caffra TaxID=77055 RepID=A0AAV1RMC6_9ROSI|nr:unnamed protein product [Dovyalis caffra]
MEGDNKGDTDMGSPSNSQQTISDDDEIDYTVKPEFYDPELDDKDELWVQKKRKGSDSDAVLSCPACFTTLCLDCQRMYNDWNVVLDCCLWQCETSHTRDEVVGLWR